MNACRNQRGLTLVEFTMVAALGAVVVMTLSSFYLSSQKMWLDASVQAVSQRDATLLMGEIGKRIEGADRVEIDPGGTQVTLYAGPNQTGLINWTTENAYADITDFEAGGAATTTRWPTTGRLQALRFHSDVANPNIVYLDSLRIETPAGQTIYLSSAFGVYNHPE